MISLIQYTYQEMRCKIIHARRLSEQLREEDRSA
jgi:hypothetical protein